MRDQTVQIKLPYLAEINRESLQRQLGSTVEVSRTAVELPLDRETWQLQLLDVLDKLARATEAAEGIAGI